MKLTMKFIQQVVVRGLCAFLLSSPLAAAFAQSVTGSFSPASVGPSTSSTLTLNYSGFTSNSTGMNLRVYFNSAAVTPGVVAYANPPGQSQPITSAVAGTLASCAGADQFFIMNWVDFGGVWPTPTSGSLGTIPFTTAPGFAANTNVCWEDDITNGAPERNITGSATLALTVTPSTAVFSIGNVTVTEAGAAGTATVTCTGAFASNTVTPVTVAYSTTNNVGNFTVAASPVSFTACGGQTRTIAVTPRVEDAVVQGTVTGTIVLGAITTDVGATISPTLGTSTVTVLDNDTPPVFSMAANAGTCAEAVAPTNCTLTIARDSGVATATTVNFTVTGTAIRGTDYTLKTGGCAAGTTLVANSISHPSAAPLVIDVCPIDDLTVEGTETVIFTLGTGAGYTLGATTARTQNIADDDSPQVVTVAVTGSPASEAAGVLTYTFTRAGGSAAAQAATLPINITPPAVSGRYSTTCASPVTFAAATATATCTVTGIDNMVLDGNVNVTVAVAAPTVAGAYTVGAPASAVGVIADDEVGVSVAATTGVVTEGGLVTFTVSCTGMASTSVPYTLTGLIGGDVQGGAASPIALTCGTPQTVTVQTQQNTNQGDNRTLTLTLGTPTGGNAALVPGQSAATASVLDDDRPLIVPTMGALGLGLMSLMLVGLAAFQRRRSMK